MLDLVKSGVGLSLARDSIAIREAQARGLVIADRVSLDCVLGFACLKARASEPVVASAWEALGRVWDGGYGTPSTRSDAVNKAMG